MNLALEKHVKKLQEIFDAGPPTYTCKRKKGNGKRAQTIAESGPEELDTNAAAAKGKGYAVTVEKIADISRELNASKYHQLNESTTPEEKLKKTSGAECMKLLKAAAASDPILKDAIKRIDCD